MDKRLRESLQRHLPVLACPKCGGDLALEDEGLWCTCCREAFGVADNIPRLFWPNAWDVAKPDVTATVRSFSANGSKNGTISGLSTLPR